MPKNTYFYLLRVCCPAGLGKRKVDLLDKVRLGKFKLVLLSKNAPPHRMSRII